MAINEIKLLDMVRLCIDQPYTVQQLANLTNLSYMEVYNFMGTKKGKFYFKSEKVDGLKFIRADPSNHYLIKGKAKLKPHQKETQQPYSKVNETTKASDLPGKCGFERKQALFKVMRINGFGQTVKKTDKKGKTSREFAFFSQFHEKQYNECLELFQNYVNRIDQMELCFEPADGLFGDTMVKPYATRFNSVPKQITLRENYEKAWKNGEALFQKASFVTLTTDPKGFKHLLHANKHFQRNWNKLITYLRKKTGKELPYVCVREFQKNGRVHFHICIFGLHLPATKKNAPYNNPISKLWKKYGQGQITDVKNLVNKDGVMQWEHGRPSDCKKDEPPMKYLKKYLIKAQYDETAQFQYWIYNARYYTYSQALLRTPKRRRGPKLYQYVGTIDREAGKFYRRHGTPGLIKHETALGTPYTPPPEQPKEELPTGFMTALYYELRQKQKVKL